MIELYSGVPGAGKSLHLASRLKSWMRYKKAPVIANFEFNALLVGCRGYGGFLRLENDELTPEFLIWFADRYRKERKLDRLPEDHIMLVVDECQLMFNAREWNKADRASWNHFFTIHRHLGYHVILCCQFIEMIDKQIRSLLEYEYIHRKVKNVGIGGFILNVLAGGGLHVCVKVYVPLKTKVGSEFFKASKTLYSLYDSYAYFDRIEEKNSGKISEPVI